MKGIPSDRMSGIPPADGVSMRCGYTGLQGITPSDRLQGYATSRQVCKRASHVESPQVESKLLAAEDVFVSSKV